MPASTKKPAGRPAVLSRAGARACGVSLQELAGSGYVRLFHDTYVPAGTKITPELRARTALGISPAGAWISHHTAVALWGGVAPASSTVHVSTTSRSARPRRRGITAHASEVELTAMRLGVRVSTPVQAFLELAQVGVELVDLVVAGDSLVKATGVSPESFVAAARSRRGRGARLARQAAELVRAGVDSPMESKLRLLIVFAGLPEPRANLILRGADGAWQRRFDLAYEYGKVLIEYDGRQHAYDDDQWGRDIDRREELDRRGWRLIVVRSADIYTRPERTLRRIRDVLLERGVPGVPAHLNPEWSRYFTGRQ